MSLTRPPSTWWGPAVTTEPCHWCLSKPLKSQWSPHGPWLGCGSPEACHVLTAHSTSSHGGWKLPRELGDRRFEGLSLSLQSTEVGNWREAVKDEFARSAKEKRADRPLEGRPLSRRPLEGRPPQQTDSHWKAGPTADSHWKAGPHLLRCTLGQIQTFLFLSL